MLLHIKNDKYTIKDLCKSSRDSHLFNKWEARYIAGGNNRCGQQNNFFLNLFIYPSFLTKINVILFLLLLLFWLWFSLFFYYLFGTWENKNNIKNVVLRCRVAFLIEWYFFCTILFYSFILSNKWLDWVWSNHFFLYPKCKYNFRIYFSSLSIRLIISHLLNHLRFL